MKSCPKYIFVVFNLLLLCGGICFIGFTLWVQYASGIHELIAKLHEGSIVLFTLLGVGVLVVFIGFLGTVGSCYENKLMLGIYLAMVLVFLVTEASVLIYSFLNQSTLKEAIGALWEHVDNKTKTLVQERFSCCGYRNSSEWNGEYPSSCINTTALGNGTILWTDSCYSSISRWIDRHIFLLVSIALIVIVTELFQIAVTGFLLNSTDKFNRVADSSQSSPEVHAIGGERPKRSVYNNRAYENDT